MIALSHPGEPQFKCLKAPVDSAPSAPPVNTRQPRSLSVSAFADPEIVVDSPSEAAPLHGSDLKQTCRRSGVAASPKPGDQCVDGDPAVGPGGSQTTSFQPAVQHAGVRGSTGLILPNRVPTLSTAAPLSTPPPALSAGSVPPPFHNQPTSFSQYARPPHLRESSAVCFAGFIYLSTCAKILIMAFCRRLLHEIRNRQVSLLTPLTLSHIPGCLNAQPQLAMRPRSRRL